MQACVPDILLRKAWVPVSLHVQLQEGGGSYCSFSWSKTIPRKIVLFEKYLHKKGPLSFAFPIPTIELDIFPDNSPALGSPSPNPLKSPIELEGNKSLKGHVVLWLSATDLGEVPKAERLEPLAAPSPTAAEAAVFICFAYGHSTSDFSPKY